ncbi:MAG: SMC-Scp complex subunit ScpB [Chloroflexi bacterium]|nr:SMC-Scp complex subunit ScpB [Chloroflexota bacterium]
MAEKTAPLSLEARVEALLFVAPSSVSATQMAQALDVQPREVEKALKSLEKSYTESGLRIQRHKSAYELTSAPEASSLIERFLDLEATSRLSAAALECLAIIAYQQPITRPSIDAIRGVNSDGVLRNLLSNGLIEEAGRAEGPGRPFLYVTTPDFLQHFGLSALEDLPMLDLEKLLEDSEAPATLKNII